MKYKNKLKVDFVEEVQKLFPIRRSEYAKEVLDAIVTKLPIYRNEKNEVRKAINLFFESLRDLILLDNEVSLSPLSKIKVKKMKNILYIKGKYHVRV